MVARGAGVGVGWYPAQCAGAGAAWSPAALDSLVLGLLESATTVDGLVSAVGGLEQASELARPAYLASSARFGGAASAVFTGSQWLAQPAAAGASVGGWTLWAAVAFDAHASVKTVLDTAAPASVPFGFLAANASNELRYGVYGYAAGPALDTTAHLVAMTLRNGSAPNFDLWVDGVLVASSASSWGDPWATNGLAAGRDHTPFGWAMRGELSAFGLTRAPMSDVEQLALAAWSRSSRGTP